MRCTECGQDHQPEPEFCPQAEWFSSGPTGGACEAYFLTTRDGRAAVAGLEYGTEEYYQAVIDGTEVMHAVGDCRV